MLAPVAAAAALACTDGERAPDPTGGGTAAQMENTVQRYGDAFIEGRYDDAYDLHTSEWQTRCAAADWERMMEMTKQALADQAVTAGGDMNTARFVIVAIETDGSRGVHQGHVEVSGEPYPFGDQAQPAGMYWVWQGGDWEATDDRQDPCPPPSPNG